MQENRNMAHLKLNTKQWIQLGKKLGYIKKAQEEDCFCEDDRESNESWRRHVERNSRERECSKCGEMKNLRSGTICDSCADKAESPWQE